MCQFGIKISGFKKKKMKEGVLGNWHHVTVIPVRTLNEVNYCRYNTFVEMSLFE